MSQHPDESPRRFSNRHLAAIVLAIVMGMALVALAAVAVGSPEVAQHAPFWLAGLFLVAGLATACAAAVSFGVEDRVHDRIDTVTGQVQGRLDELTGQIAALAESVETYGAEREAAGVVSGLRAAARGNVHTIHT